MGLSERITQPNTLRMFCMRYFLQLQVVYQPVQLWASPPLKDLLPMPCKNTEISTQKGIHPWPAIPTTIWEHFPLYCQSVEYSPSRHIGPAEHC